tara:strand:+ start:1235 stop:1456 length:222 start_codon:yes stop_codon:yes gene_type:complete
LAFYKGEKMSFYNEKELNHFRGEIEFTVRQLIAKAEHASEEELEEIEYELNYLQQRLQEIESEENKYILKGEQ